MSPTPEGPSGSPGYEEVRRRLRERGYLEGRIERFVLGGLGDPAAKARALVRPALRAAVLGGPILGALLAAAAVRANRPLLDGADGLVLWAWFLVPAAVGLFLLDLAAAGIVAALARRRGPRPADPIRAALLAGIPTLAYLVLLGGRREAGEGIGADALFLVAAVAATLLVAWLAGVVSVAGILRRTGDVPQRPSRATRLTVAALATAGAAVVLLALPARGRAEGSAPSPFAAAPRGERFLVLAIDGLDGDVVEALATDGAVDGILAFLAEGAVFPLRPRPAIEPPEVWTTLATGMPPEVHGVRSAGVARLPGVATPLRADAGPLALGAAFRFLLPARTAPVTGAARGVRTVWEIVGLARPIAVVGWWATWPAPEGEGMRGYVVTDRLLPKLLAGADADRDTFPASLFARLRSDFDAERVAARRDFERSWPEGERSASAWESFLIDHHATRTLETLLADPEVAAGFVYLPGLDILRARLEETERSGGLADRLQGRRTLERYVRFLDGLVLRAAAEHPALVLVADPGRAAGPAAEGFVAVRAPGVAPRCVGPALGLVDVAPLLLRLAGFPASREMPGTAPRRCLDGVADLPRIESWGRRDLPSRPVPSEWDAEMVERLKSLGYVK